MMQSGSSCLITPGLAVQTRTLGYVHTVFGLLGLPTAHYMTLLTKEEVLSLFCHRKWCAGST